MSWFRDPRALAVAVGAMCVFATLTIWMEAAYAERCFQASILILGALVAVRHGLPGATLSTLALAAVALWGPLQWAAGWSAYAYETWNAALRWFTLVVAFILVRHALGGGKVRGWALTAIAAFGAALAIFSTVQDLTSHGQYFWLIPSGQPDVFGPFQNKNNYAAFIELTLPLALWEALGPGPRRNVWLALAGIMAASVIASGSRAGSVLVALEIPTVFVIAYWRSRCPWRDLLTTAAKTLLAAMLCLAVTGWGILARKLDVVDPFVNRREMLQSAIAMARDQPWTGFGLGTFPTVYPAYAIFDLGYYVNHAHNDWAEWAAEGGLPFLILLAALAAATIPAAIRSGWGLGLLAVYLHGLVDYPMQRTGLVVWLFAVAAALAAGRSPQRH